MNPPNYNHSIRVVLADDHPLFIEIFEKFLKKDDSIRVIGHANDGRALIDLVDNELPDIVITDVKMPILNGIDATRILKKKFPQIGVIAFTFFNDDRLVLQMLEAGADGYLVKSLLETEIIDAIKSVYNKEMYYCSTVSNRLVRLMSKGKSKSGTTNHSQLTEKEVEIIRLICQEFSSKEIANRLNIPLRTVESARERIQEKIGARNMVGIATYAIKTGIYNLAD